MTPRREHDLFVRGVQLFNAQRFFLAHEVWEEIWHGVTGERRDFYQGLIQIAVGLEQFRRGHGRGAVKMLAKARRRFAQAPTRLLGLDSGQLLGQYEHAIAPLLAADAGEQNGVTMDAGRLFEIHPEGEPFGDPTDLDR